MPGWVDILIVCIILKCAKDGISKGIIYEFFQLFGIFFTIFVTLHYFNYIGFFFQFYDPLLPFNNFIGFVIVGCVCAAISNLVSDGWRMMLNLKVPTVIDEWGGLIFSSAKGFFLSGLVVFSVLTPIPRFFHESVDRSLMGQSFRDGALVVYVSVFDSIVKKISTRETMNPEILMLLEN